METFLIAFVIFETACVYLIESRKECFIDENKSAKDLKNIYHCDENEECCSTGGKAMCCASKPAFQIFSEQFGLWGSLFAVLASIAIAVYCWKNDINCIQNKFVQNCLGHCCSASKKKHKENICANNEHTSKVV